MPNTGLMDTWAEIGEEKQTATGLSWTLHTKGWVSINPNHGHEAMEDHRNQTEPQSRILMWFMDGITEAMTVRTGTSPNYTKYRIRSVVQPLEDPLELELLATKEV